MIQVDVGYFTSSINLVYKIKSSLTDNFGNDIAARVRQL